MNIAIVKIGARISTSNNNIRNGNAGENRKIIDLFVQNNHSVDLLTLVGKQDNPSVYFNYDNIRSLDIADNYVDTSLYDALVVINGTNNFFGGEDNYNLCETYHVINNFKGPILYFYTDPLCALKQIWGDNFHKRNEKWGTDWKKEDLFISRNDMIMISAATDVDFEKKPFKSKSVIKDFARVEVFEWQKSVLLEPAETVNTNKDVDLVYGGFYRGGTRHKQMEEYLFDTPYSSRFFGKIQPKHFESEYEKRPEFYEKTGDWSFFKKETNKALATIIFAEDTYHDSIVTMRVYASILSNVVVFIDEKYDSKHRTFNNDFNYVNSKSDVAARLARLKTEPGLFEEIVTAQLNAHRLDRDIFYNEFNSLLDFIEPNNIKIEYEKPNDLTQFFT